MKWGLSFRLPATFESDMLGLPPPSDTLRLKNGEGKETINIFYHFLYAPQSKKEWQRVAAIKAQMKSRIPGIEFQEYEPVNVSGKIYTVSELGSYFKDFVKFPMPYFEGSPQAILTKHAKRLHYEGLLHVEQLIFVSMWIKEIAPKRETGRRKKDEGIRQVMKRAFSAYYFALDHKDEWTVKLNKDELVKAHQLGASKTNQQKRVNASAKSKEARVLKAEGKTLSDIAVHLGVSLRTVSNYLKK